MDFLGNLNLYYTREVEMVHYPFTIVLLSLDCPFTIILLSLDYPFTIILLSLDYSFTIYLTVVKNG